MRSTFIVAVLIFLLTNYSYSQKNYKNAEECILDKIVFSKNAEASLAIIEACKKLYPITNKVDNQNHSIDKKKLEDDIKTLAEIMDLLKVEMNKLAK
jgi:hypothetical protein